MWEDGSLGGLGPAPLHNRLVVEPMRAAHGRIGDTLDAPRVRSKQDCDIKGSIKGEVFAGMSGNSALHFGGKRIPFGA